MNVISSYIDFRNSNIETIEYYNLYLQAIEIEGIKRYIVSKHNDLFYLPKDYFCGMVPSKFSKILTNDNHVDHAVRLGVILFFDKKDCLDGINRLKNYLRKRDYS
jgi:hypothetical protein